MVPRSSRRAAVALLAVFLNLALVPCSMAIEVVEEGHDCCPPELKLEAQECCELDDASVDSRSGTHEHDGSPDLDALATGEPADVSAFSAARFLATGELRGRWGVGGAGCAAGCRCAGVDSTDALAVSP